MNATQLDREIRSRIEGFVSTLSKLVKDAAVESVHWALKGGGPSQSPVSARAAVRRAARGRPVRVAKRGKRSSADVEQTAELVLAYVKAHPGQRLEEIGRGLKVDTQGLKLPIAKLLAAKKLRTTGQKRGTKYFAGGAGAPKPRPKSAKRKPARRAAKRQAKRPSKRAAQPAAAGAAPSPVPPPTDGKVRRQAQS